MPTHEFFQVDAFADRPFAGNPAAVFILDHPANELWMRNVAREMNLSETAFLHRAAGNDDALFDLRWFTPAVEVDLCGHATLASAHILWETNVLPRNVEPRFQSRSGMLGAKWLDGWIELDFPSTPPEPEFADLDAILGLGGHVINELRTPFDLMIELDSAQVLRELQPDLSSMGALRARGLIMTARSDDPQFDFISRFFAPQSGVGEDPVTGSAHCALAPYWAEKLGKTRMLAYQASERGGIVRVELRGERVGLGGQAVTVTRGDLISV